MENQLLVILAYAGGILLLIVSMVDWEYFMKSKPATTFTRILVGDDIRLLSFLVGLFLLFLGIW